MNKQFIEQQIEKELQKKTLSDDYFEFLELALLFLGGTPKKKSFQVTFRPPGAMHHARWMSKTLCSLKIFLFRKQFKLTARQSRGPATLNVFFDPLLYQALVPMFRSMRCCKNRSKIYTGHDPIHYN